MFKVGDRVRCVRVDMDSDIVLGFTGTIKHIGIDIAVEFDNPFDGGHTCAGTTQQYHGWWVSRSSIELIGDEHDDESAQIDEAVFIELLAAI